MKSFCHALDVAFSDTARHLIATPNSIKAGRPGRPESQSSKPFATYQVPAPALLGAMLSSPRAFIGIAYAN
jgi:hypothetical protein